MSNAETTNHCSAPWSNLEIFVFSLKCFVVRATMRTRLPRSPSASWCHQSTTSVFIAVWDTCDRNDEIKQCMDVICLLKVVKYSPQMSILCFWTTSHTITSCWFVVRLLLSIKLCSCRAVCAKTAKQWKCYTSVLFCQHVPVSEGGNYLLLSPRQRYLQTDHHRSKSSGWQIDRRWKHLPEWFDERRNAHSRSKSIWTCRVSRTRLIKRLHDVYQAGNDTLKTQFLPETSCKAHR